MTGLAPDVMVEAVDGPIAIAALVGKGMPVLTRLPSGTRGFRIISKVVTSEYPVPIVRVRLDNGRAVTLATGQIVYRCGLFQVAAGALEPGTILEASFHYPAGYRLGGAVPGNPGDGEPGIRVLAVEPQGESLVYSGRVNETGCAFLTAGVLCALS